ncbi:MAG: hypothetical protein ABIJ93_01065, partial [candidate division WOR-3 bacterium]
MDKNSAFDIGYIIEVRGERALVEIRADTTKSLAEDYYPGQPGSYVKIPFRDFKIIGTVTSIRVETGSAVSSGAGRKVAECILLGTLEHDERFIRGVAVYPNVGQPVQMVSSHELNK